MTRSRPWINPLSHLRQASNRRRQLGAKQSNRKICLVQDEVPDKSPLKEPQKSGEQSDGEVDAEE
jgi:hypothetical protein